MSQALSEYFVTEAGEYLEQLGRVLAGGGVPDPEQLFRLARGVRGSAEMAQVDRIAAVAVRMEQAARAVRDGQIPWNTAARDRFQTTVGDLEILLRAVRSWGPAEEDRVRAAIARWLSSPPPASEAPALTAHGSGEVVPIESLFFDDAGPHIITSKAPAEVVGIETLLFEREDALRRALSLRPRVERLVGEAGAASAELDELLVELFDLIQLGAAPDTPPGNT